jgi:hypothetical protein
MGIAKMQADTTHFNSSNSIVLQLSADKSLLSICAYFQQQTKISFGTSVTSIECPAIANTEPLYAILRHHANRVTQDG